jgi:hypothetical protein
VQAPCWIGVRQEGLQEAWTAVHQSEYFVPSMAVAAAPLLTSQMQGAAVELFGSGSEGMVRHESVLLVNGSFATDGSWSPIISTYRAS